MMLETPEHIAIIMDGNGRWAKQKRLPRIEGHRAGAAAVEEAIEACLQLKVKVLSLYTFSAENWQRPKKEVDALMGLLERYLKTHLGRLNKNNIRLFVSGDKTALPGSLQQQIENVISQTGNNSSLILNLALNYGGRQDILHAARNIAQEVERRDLQLSDINEKTFSAHLYTGILPDPELLIRTSGELRLSNFFIWQLSYSELYFSSKFWPDFKKEDLFEAVRNYRNRERRFGR